LGPEIDLLGDDHGIAYKTKGDFGNFMLSIAQTIDYHFFLAEFGTYSGLRILRALRAENQAHFFSSKSSIVSKRAQAELLECFCPASPSWRETVLKQGIQLLQAAAKMAPLSGNA
jgi:hypothetical protein